MGTERLHTLLANIPDVVWTSDSQGKTTFISPNVKQIYGFTPDEILQAGSELWLDRIHPDDIAHVQEAYESLLARGEMFDVEYRIRHRDGHWIWLHDRATASYEVDGIKYADGVFNHACENTTGYSFDEVCAKYVWDQLLVLEEMEPVKHVFKDLQSGQFPSQYENYWVARDGERRLIAWTNTALLDDAGVVEYVIGTGVDITERKQAEAQLLTEKAFTDMALDAQLDTFFLFEPATGKTLRWNRAFRDISGYTDEEIARMPAPASYYSPEDLERAAAFIQRVLVEGTGTIELELVCRDGRRVPTEYRVSVINDDQGEPKYVISIGRDITERKQSEMERARLQERLVQAGKMEAVGRLAGGIAHDFNNVLTAIQGYGHILLDDLASDDPKTWPAAQSFRADLGEILASADRAASLTQQLLAFSRKQVLQPRVLNLNDLLHGMENMMRRLIGEDISLLTVLAPDLGDVHADPGQIEQVIMNLSVNARDAMPHGGKLTFETRNVELDEAYAQTHPDVDPGRYALLAVSDDGMGMSDEVRAHLFEPFFTTKEQGSGTGLGLATVYGIVEQSGGHIEVYSELAIGTTFKVYLPLSEGRTGLSESKGAAQSLPTGTETVLVVEDEQPVRDLVRRVLDRCGYTVLAAGHPQQALASSEEHIGDVHLLVTDVVMPEMGGRDLAERLVSSRPAMKVLYISGYTDEAIARHGVLEPGVDVLEKPFAPTDLAYKVREVLDEAPPKRA